MIKQNEGLRFDKWALNKINNFFLQVNATGKVITTS
jgi:hypothetical protein